MNIVSRFSLSTCLTATFMLFFSLALHGQSSIPIRFHGSNLAFSQYANTAGMYQELDAFFFRNDLQMTLLVHDIPISARLFVTTEETTYRQNINHFRIYFDASEMLRNKGLTGDMITAVARNRLSTLQDSREQFENAREQLNVASINALNEMDMLHIAEDKAYDQLQSVLNSPDSTEVNQAREAYREARENAEQARQAYEQALRKLEETDEQIDQLSERLQEAREKLEEARSLRFDSGSARRKAEAEARRTAMSGFSRLLSAFNTLELGQCRPNYSELILRGVSMSGVNIEFNPGIFYSAFAKGKIKRAIRHDTLAQPVFEQNMLFAKLGLGRKQGTHWHVSYMQAKDDVFSIPEFSYPGAELIRPMANHVLGSELKLSMLKNKLNIEGEVAVSMITRDTQSPEITGEINQLPDWAVNRVKHNVSSSTDYAYDVKATLKLSSTEIIAGLRMVGPGYITLGNRNLVNDRATKNVRINHHFARRQISLALFYRQYNDNLIKWKNATSSTRSYGINAALRFRNKPWISFTYAPNFQETGSDTLKLNNTVGLLSVSSGHHYSIGNTRANTNLSYYRQNTETVLDISRTWYNSTNLSFSQTFSFSKPFSLAMLASYIQASNNQNEYNIVMLNLNGSFGMIRNKLHSTLGVNYTYMGADQKKLGYLLNTQVSLWSGGTVGIRIEKNTFEDIFDTKETFNEFIAQFSLEVRW